MTATSEDRSAEDRASRLREAIRKKKAARDQTFSGKERMAGTQRIPPRPADSPARLGPMQRSLWLAHRLDPDSAAYHLVDAYRVRGQLDVEKLKNAFRNVVRRHRLLRSSFRSTESGVVQEILPIEAADERFDLEVVSTDGGNPKEAAVREAQHPFDLSKPPLVRLILLQQQNRPAMLVLVLHHILADEHGLGVFWREISTAFRGQLSGATPTAQYDDLVHWLGQTDLQQQALDAWRSRLDPSPDDLALPFESASVEGEPGDAGRLVVHPLPAEVARGVRELAQRTDSTPFLVTAFAYGLLLRRYSEGAKPAFASPVSTRVQAGAADIIGYFTNPVVMPTHLDESLNVESAMGAFRKEALERMSGASVPFQELIEELDPPRSFGRHPIFQTMFVLRRPGPLPDLGPGPTLERLTLDLGASKFDLTLFVTETDRADLELAAEYRADRYREDGVRQFLGHYETLLRNLAESAAESPVQDVSMLGNDEARRLSDFGRGPELTRELDLLPLRTAAVAKASADEPSVLFEGRTTTYATLDEEAQRVADELASIGTSSPLHVGLFMPRSAEAIAAIVGIQRAGAAYVPLDPTYPMERNRAVLDDADVVAVVTKRELEDRLPDGPWRVVRMEDTASGTGSVVEPDIRADDPAYLLYTSGSTGRPKGVVVSHENLRVSTASRLQVYEDLGVRPGRFLLLPSLAFDSSVAGLFWCQALGDSLVLPTDDEARDPRALVRVIERDRVTSLLCVPSLWAQVLRFAEGTDALGTLEAVIVAGESCPWTLVREHFERLPGTRLFNEYGPTEATVWATLHELTAEEPERLAGYEPVSIGRPIPGARVEVEDPEGRAVPIGVPGLGWIAGGTVSAGYRGRTDLTEARFEIPPDGIRRYRTGDRMEWTRDGRLLFLGREDEEIKLRGFRIEPGEIESVLLDAGAKQVAVVAQTTTGNRANTQQLVAFVDGEVPGWREFLESKLPAHMVPSRLVSLDALPRLPNGKIDRGGLREMTLPETSADRGRVRQREVPGTLEQALLSLWRGLLGVDEVDLDDNFFEMGGHSLLVAEMTLALERDLGSRITAADVFQHPTVRGLAQRLQQGERGVEPYAHLFPIQPLGNGAPLLVCVPHVFSGTFAQQFRGERPVYGLRGVSLRQEGNLGRWPTMSHLAGELVHEVERRFPDPPEEGFLVAGYSFGGSMAVEMVRRMRERGVAVQRLFLIAPMPLDFVDLGPLRVQLRPLRRPTHELTTGDVLRTWLRDHDPRTSVPYRRLWRALKVLPLRHALARLGRLGRRLGLQHNASTQHAVLHADVRVERFRLHKSYRPGPVETPTTIFNAEENAETPGTDAAATWRPVFRDLEVVPTPDPHRDEEAVAAAKEVILRHLRDLR
ncbi:MAG: amino acid adenylation domain-containing protein [Thermoanaerobaculia bacterium]|nr:amino acid adenylation domain-containing protein [Thermoanaerobaculia bacterium]